MDKETALRKSIHGGLVVKEEEKKAESSGDDDGSSEEIDRKGSFMPKMDISSPEFKSNKSPTQKGQEDLIKSAKAEMGEAIEENQRLEMCLYPVMEDYRTLQMQFHEMVHQEPNKSSSTVTTNHQENEEPELVLSLSLGRSSSDGKKEDNKYKNHGKEKIDEDDKEGLALGLECKFQLPKHNDNAQPEHSTNPSLGTSSDEVKEEAGETWPPQNGSKTGRNGGQDEVSQQNPTMNDGCQWRKYGGNNGVIRAPSAQQSLLHGTSSAPFKYSANPIRPPRHMIALSLLDMELPKKRRETHEEKPTMTGWLLKDIKQEAHRESPRPLCPKEKPEASLQEKPIPPHPKVKQQEAAPQQRLEENENMVHFQAALKNLNQPTREIDPPKGALSVPLFSHQKMALAWMVEKEKGEGVCAGGILADDQGLGKTISMIALIQTQWSLQVEHKADKSALEVGEDEKVSRALGKMEPKVEYDGDMEGVSKRRRITHNWKPEAVTSEVLILDDDDEGKRAPSGGPVELKPKVQSIEVEEILRKMGSSDKPAAGTLVVCPASVLRQWARELDEKVTEESKLSVLVYHGSKRTTDPVVLAKYDVVLTTYSLVAMEVPKQALVGTGGDNEEKYKLSSTTKKRKKTSGNEKGKKTKAQQGRSSNNSDCGTLAKVRWFRVILDEAHIIKNHRTKVARACCSLRAKSSWCLSGTPIQNKIEELYSYFRFLRHKPYSNYSSFNAGVKKIVKTGSEHGYKRLRCVLKTIMLRRTKATLIDGKPLLILPPKTTHLSKVDFSDEERAFYDELEGKYTRQFMAFAARGTILKNYATIFVMILRLRQACDHPILVINGSGRGQESLEIAKNLPPEKLQSLLVALENSSAICSVCSDRPENAVVTTCGHVCCYQCGREYFAAEATTCPEDGCEEEMNADALFTEEILHMCLSNDFDRDSSNSSGNSAELTAIKNGSSSKIKAAVQILQSYCKPQINELEHWNGCTSSETGFPGSEISKPAKAIVFSQWTGMLDLIEDKLRETNLEFRRLDGSMSLLDRDKAVKDFNTKPEVTVMIMSLKAGNLGLNMVAACRVILLDPWWNPTTEDQAIDRAHRIGQTRPVTVTRLTIAKTIEDRILALQEKKRKLVSDVLGKDQNGGVASRLTVEDLKSLFNVR